MKHLRHLKTAFMDGYLHNQCWGYGHYFYLLRHRVIALEGSICEKEGHSRFSCIMEAMASRIRRLISRESHLATIIYLQFMDLLRADGAV